MSRQRVHIDFRSNSKYAGTYTQGNKIQLCTLGFLISNLLSDHLWQVDGEDLLPQNRITSYYTLRNLLHYEPLVGYRV